MTAHPNDPLERLEHMRQAALRLTGVEREALLATINRRLAAIDAAAGPFAAPRPDRDPRAS